MKAVIAALSAGAHATPVPMLAQGPAYTAEQNAPLCSQQLKLLKNYWHKIGSNVAARKQRGVSLGLAFSVSLPVCVFATQVLVRCIICIINVLHWPRGLGESKCLCKYSSLFHKSCVCTADIQRVLSL